MAGEHFAEGSPIVHPCDEVRPEIRALVDGERQIGHDCIRVRIGTSAALSHSHAIDNQPSGRSVGSRPFCDFVEKIRKRRQRTQLPRRKQLRPLVQAVDEHRTACQLLWIPAFRLPRWLLAVRCDLVIGRGRNVYPAPLPLSYHGQQLLAHTPSSALAFDVFPGDGSVRRDARSIAPVHGSVTGGPVAFSDGVADRHRVAVDDRLDPDLRYPRALSQRP